MPAKPPHVITAAVLGFIFGALGVLVSLFAIIGGAVATGAADSADEEFRVWVRSPAPWVGC